MNPLFDQVRKLAAAWHLPPAKKTIPNALSYRLADRSVVIDLESRTTLRIVQTTGSLEGPTSTNIVRITRRVSERLAHHERALTQAIGHFMLLQENLNYCDTFERLGKLILDHKHSPANFIPVLLDDTDEGMFVCKVCGDRFALAPHVEIDLLHELFPDPLQWLRTLTHVAATDFGSFYPREIQPTPAIEIKTYGAYRLPGGLGIRYLAPGIYVRGLRDLDRVEPADFFERYHKPVPFDETPNRFERSEDD